MVGGNVNGRCLNVAVPETTRRSQMLSITTPITDVKNAGGNKPSESHFPPFFIPKAFNEENI